MPQGKGKGKGVGRERHYHGFICTNINVPLVSSLRRGAENATELFSFVLNNEPSVTPSAL